MSSLRIESISQISLERFNIILKRYVTTAPSSLADLDKLRYETIPAKLAKNNKDAHLPKVDVEKLVEWKLKHGTFRPTLMNLVKSNSPDLIKETTRLSFLESDPMRSLKTLTSLRGIGPATASLLLSVHQPDVVPFFSDELFRWTHWDAPGKSGWERRIKYNVTEYKELLASVEGLRKRLGVRAVDAEKVAYVLGKEMADVDGGVHGEEVAREAVEGKVQGENEAGRGSKDAQEESRVRVQEALKEIREEKAREDESGKKRGGEDSRVSKGAKRKAREENASTEGTRKSTRRKA